MTGMIPFWKEINIPFNESNLDSSDDKNSYIFLNLKISVRLIPLQAYSGIFRKGESYTEIFQNIY